MTVPLRTTARALKNAAALLTIGALSACSQPTDRVLAHSDLVRLMVVTEQGQRILRLDAEPGVRISARLQPVLDLGGDRRISLENDSVTVDSSYFTGSPRVLLSSVDGRRATLLVGACPAEILVCRSIALEVDIADARRAY